MLTGTDGEPADANELLLGLVRQTMVGTGVSAAEWATREAQLTILAAQIMSSSMNARIGDIATVAHDMKRMLVRRGESRLCDRAQSIVENLGAGHTKMLYFLLRTAQKTNGQPSLTFDLARSVFDRAAVLSERGPASVPEARPAPVAVAQTPECKGVARWAEYASTVWKDEPVVLRELVYVLQGADGSMMRWDGISKQYSVAKDYGMPRPVRALVQELARLGSQYRTTVSLMAEGHRESSLLRQAFWQGIARESREYLRSIVSLESTLDGMTLRQLFIWMQPTARVLSFVHSVATRGAAMEAHALLTFIHALCQQGNASNRAASERLLADLLDPYWKALGDYLNTGMERSIDLFVAEGQADLKKPRPLSSKNLSRHSYCWPNQPDPRQQNRSKRPDGIRHRKPPIHR